MLDLSFGCTTIWSLNGYRLSFWKTTPDSQLPKTKNALCIPNLVCVSYMSLFTRVLLHLTISGSCRGGLIWWPTWMISIFQLQTMVSEILPFVQTSLKVFSNIGLGTWCRFLTYQICTWVLSRCKINFNYIFFFVDLELTPIGLNTPNPDHKQSPVDWPCFSFLRKIGSSELKLICLFR